MMTVVPLLRTEPTDGNMPERICQSSACSAASMGELRRLRTVESLRGYVGRDLFQFRARALVGGLELGQQSRRGLGDSERSEGGIPALSSTERNEARSMISSALAPAWRSGTIESAAA